MIFVALSYCTLKIDKVLLSLNSIIGHSQFNWLIIAASSFCWRVYWKLPSILQLFGNKNRSKQVEQDRTALLSLSQDSDTRLTWTNWVNGGHRVAKWGPRSEVIISSFFQFSQVLATKSKFRQNSPTKCFQFAGIYVIKMSNKQ